ncbi:MAG: hypothetical protein C3F11_08375 [Methylocystaceae bacterium]|nr:MAG: hypothetical protein C3F11_08375 [Methylocystaceae bacterium]
MSKNSVLTCRRERGTPLENIDAAFGLNTTAASLLDMVRFGAENIDRIDDQEKENFGWSVCEAVRAVGVILDEMSELLLAAKVDLRNRENDYAD